MGIIERSIGNAVAVTVLGQIPPFTFLPEEGLTIPTAVALGIIGVDLTKELGKVIE